MGAALFKDQSADRPLSFIFVMVCLLGAYKAGAFGRELLDTATARYLVFQKDYENYETISYELHGYTFIIPGRETEQDMRISPLPRQRLRTFQREYHRRGLSGCTSFQIASDKRKGQERRSSKGAYKEMEKQIRFMWQDTEGWWEAPLSET